MNKAMRAMAFTFDNLIHLELLLTVMKAVEDV